MLAEAEETDHTTEIEKVEVLIREQEDPTDNHHQLI